MKTKCMVPECSSEVKLRGLCGTCYSLAAKLVSQGRTSFAKLVEEGKCLETKTELAARWFTKGK